MSSDDSNQLVRPFPWPNAQSLIGAYNTLVMAASNDEDVRQTLGDPSKLPRPWDPATCTGKQLRLDLWAWLEEFVTWLNHEYVWDHTSGGLIPLCWPRHPHLVHDIAVLADQRRRAGLDLTSSALEEWHRYGLPTFLDRLRTRTGTLCDEHHTTWPAHGRHQRHTSRQALQDRLAAYADDAADLPDKPPPAPPRATPPRRPILQIIDGDGDRIDPHTGEVL